MSTVHKLVRKNCSVVAGEERRKRRQGKTGRVEQAIISYGYVIIVRGEKLLCTMG